MNVLGVWPRFPRGTSVGNRYAELNRIYQELSEQVGVDLWRLDGLWHVINETSKHDADAAFQQSELEEKAYLEGRRIETSGYRIERNAKARSKCINALGLDCFVCGFNFFKVFGELGMGYIHVHYVDDIAISTESHEVNPKKGLVPVCPNCHAMLHKGVKKSRSVDDQIAVMHNVASQRGE